MVHVTERAKEVLLETKRSANIKDPEVGLRLAYSPGGGLGLFADRMKAGDQVVKHEVGLRLAHSPGGGLGLFADRMKAGDQVVKHEDSTVLLVDAELSELFLAGRTVDCTQIGGKTDLVLTAPGGRAPGQR